MTSADTHFDNATISAVVTQTADQLMPRDLFHFNAPRQTVVGEGAVLKLGDVLRRQSVRHVFFVVDKVVLDNGLLRGAQRSLARTNIECTVFSGVHQEPGTAVIEQGAELLSHSQADFVIGFGGGSAIDAAKVIAMLSSCHCTVSDLLEPDFGGHRAIGLGAIPTTAGTGSEVTDISVILEADRHKKLIVKHAGFMPDLAIIDAGLMINLPASITAATGIDALTHAIEAFTARNSNPLSSALAIAAIKKLAHALPIVVGNGEDHSARSDMAIGAYEAGLAFSNSGLGLVHAISHQVGARYELAHGVANGILLPFVMEFNGLVCRSEYGAIAQVFGVARESMTVRQQCDAGVKAVRQLLADIGLPATFTQAGAEEKHFAEIASAALQDICITTNPRSVTEADIKHILQQVSGTST